MSTKPVLPEEEVIPGIEDADVVTKYKMAGEMASRVLGQIQEACTVGAKTIDICKLGDLLIEKEVSGCYNKKLADGKLMKKGVAFPTCISINNCVCHNSPLPSCKEVLVADGDLIKIDLALHIDGYIAPAATSFVVGAGPVTGKQADVLLAAHTASEAALRMLKPGAKTYTITDTIDKIAKAYGCTALEGMLSHQLSKNKIDGEKAIIQAPTPQLRKEHKEFTIEVNEVYGLDVIMTTGDGKAREGEERTTVFKATETPYALKMQASRKFASEMKKSFGVMPFNLRAMSDEKTAKLGVSECAKHDVVNSFKILWEKKGEFVAQFKMLVMVMPNGTVRGTTTGFSPDAVTSEVKFEDEEILALLATTIGSKNKKKKKKNKGGAAPAAAEGGDAAAVAE